MNASECLRMKKKKQTSMDSFVSATGRQAAEPQPESNETDPGKQIKRIIQIGRHDMKLFVNNFSNISFHFAFVFVFISCFSFSPFFFFVVLACAAFWFCGRRQRGKGNGDSLPAPAPAPATIYSLYIVCIRFSSVSVSIRVLFPWNCMPNGADMQ